MKRITLYFAVLAVVTGGLVACDNFLEMPDTTGKLDQDEVYSSSITAHQALMRCYRTILQQGLNGGNGLSSSTDANLSGERARGKYWHEAYKMAPIGLLANDISGTRYRLDNYEDGWAQIRACYLVKENIDQVPDMNANDKLRYKAEATALIAYRYMGMFYRYGGVAIIRGSIEPGATGIPRSSLQDTLDFILGLCDEALPHLPASLPDSELGRMTQGAVLAIKARTLMFAARPLFNSATTYLPTDHPELISFGEADSKRWEAARDANIAILNWASTNGYALIGPAEGVKNTFEQAVHDYGTAVSTPSNKEVILAYKCNAQADDSWAYGLFRFLNTRYDWYTGDYEWEHSGLLNNSLEKYYTKDGGNQNWPKIGDAAPRPISDYETRILDMEARMQLDWKFSTKSNEEPYASHISNPGDQNYQAWNTRDGQDKATFAWSNTSTFPNAAGQQAPHQLKFWYMAGSRTWTELPLFRLAETYLYLAEAYNECGNYSEALKCLNRIHNRAGLPSLTVADYNSLKAAIQREMTIELMCEHHRYYDAKHWKIDDIATGGLSGPMRVFSAVTTENNISPSTLSNMTMYLKEYWDSVTYTVYWDNRMYLEPIPQDEVNKGVTIQNPGY